MKSGSRKLPDILDRWGVCVNGLTADNTANQKRLQDAEYGRLYSLYEKQRAKKEMRGEVEAPRSMGESSPQGEGGPCSEGAGLSSVHISPFVLGSDTVSVCRDAFLVKVKRWQLSEVGTVGGKRGYACFSKASMRRLKRKLASLKKENLPVFVTLTYPAEWPFDYQVWKSQLEVFYKRLVRAFGKVGFVWKLEPQERGAPHYHLLIYGVKYSYRLRVWIKENWSDITNNPHVNPCANIDKIHNFRGVLSYCAKYMSKEVESLDGWDQVGRWWGVKGAKNLPWGEWYTLAVESGVSINIIRILRKAIIAQYKVKARGIRARIAEAEASGKESAGLARMLAFVNGAITRYSRHFQSLSMITDANDIERLVGYAQSGGFSSVAVDASRKALYAKICGVIDRRNATNI